MSSLVYLVSASIDMFSHVCVRSLGSVVCSEILWVTPLRAEGRRDRFNIVMPGQMLELQGQRFAMSVVD